MSYLYKVLVIGGLGFIRSHIYKLSKLSNMDFRLLLVVDFSLY